MSVDDIQTVPGFVLRDYWLQEKITDVEYKAEIDRRAKIDSVKESVVKAALDLVAARQSNFTSRGKSVGLQDDAGEKMWIVPFDEMFALESALEGVSIPQENPDDRVCQEPDGCPIELAVLQRFWREHQNSDHHSTPLSNPTEKSKIESAKRDIRWVMQNLPIDFVMREECPVDMLMHALWVLESLTPVSTLGAEPVAWTSALELRRMKNGNYGRIQSEIGGDFTMPLFQPVAGAIGADLKDPPDSRTGWVNVRVEDTGDGLIINADDAKKYDLKPDQFYEGRFLSDGKYYLSIPRREASAINASHSHVAGSDALLTADATPVPNVSGSEKPTAHLVWLQGRRGPDDVEDYYEVARPGDKSVDGSDPFPVYARPLPLHDVCAVVDEGNTIRLHFSEVKSAKAFRNYLNAALSATATEGE